MYWDEAEAAIKLHIETQWALGAFAAVPLVFANEGDASADTFVSVEIEGIWADKTIYGSAGKRLSVEGGIVFFHAFVPIGSGKAAATAPVVAMQAILELQTISSVIKLDGANPPSPVGHGDQSVSDQQPGGNFYRCSGSVPFIVIGTR